MSDKYTVLSNNENYKSIGVKPNKHCVFRCTFNNNFSANGHHKHGKEEKEDEKEKGEYISCDGEHFALYTHGRNHTPSLTRLKVKHDDNIDIKQFEDAICVSFTNTNGMYCINMLR